jgi:hypothetical protein
LFSSAVKSISALPSVDNGLTPPSLSNVPGFATSGLGSLKSSASVGTGVALLKLKILATLNQK